MENKIANLVRSRKTTVHNQAFSLSLNRYIRESPCTVASDLYADMTRSIYSFRQKPQRDYIVNTSYRKICVSDISDDFYTSLLDWRKDKTILCGAGKKAYLYNTIDGTVTKIGKSHRSQITALKFNQAGDIVIAENSGKLSIANIETGKICFQSQAHCGRISTIVSDGNNMLCTGGRDKIIRKIDMRQKHVVSKAKAHFQEVCGLSYNTDCRYLGSGGNDNLVFIWDNRQFHVPIKKITGHRAAVKALSWSPLRSHMICTGGGTADKWLKLWDINSPHDSPKQELNTGSQICNLYWTSEDKIITTHGYSQSEIHMYDYPSLEIRIRYIGHTCRVVHFCIDSKEMNFATSGSDNTVRLWHLKSSETAKWFYR